MAVVYLGIGSNIDPDRHITMGLTALMRLGQRGLISPLYRTEPLGPLPQSWYHNCVVMIQTDLEPEALLAELKVIERQAGRVESPKWSARPLDIDILLYDSLTIDTVSLHIPHRDLPRRRFALQPLSDIAPTVVDPRSGKTMRRLLQECTDPLRVERLTSNEQYGSN